MSSHKQLDKEWSRLNRSDKEYALRLIHSWLEKEKQSEQQFKRIKEAEKDKRVGKECTCLPEYKNGSYVDLLCSYCRWEHHKDYINSPG